MKILIMSNPPWMPTGYGNQIGLLIPRLIEAGHEIALIPIGGHTGQTIEHDGYTVYPTFGDSVGNNLAAQHARHFGADFILTLTDLWVLDPSAFGQTPWVPWFPADHKNIPPSIIAKLKTAFFPIAMSRFGQDSARKAGIENEFIPHAVDSEIFFPFNKKQARIMVDFPDGKFIIGMVAANKGNRKRFHENMLAFSVFQEKHPDSMLYIHASPGNRGISLEENLSGFAYLNNIKNVVFPDPYKYLMGYSPLEMNAVYNALDVHVLVSAGEGFCVPMIEAQACGIPVICGNWTAMPEICFNGWKVNKAVTHWTNQNEWQYTPDVYAIAEKLEAAYNSIKDGRKQRVPEELEDYNADRVFDSRWKPTLSKIEEKLETPRGVPGLEILK